VRVSRHIYTISSLGTLCPAVARTKCLVKERETKHQGRGLGLNSKRALSAKRGGGGGGLKRSLRMLESVLGSLLGRHAGLEDD